MTEGDILVSKRDILFAQWNIGDYAPDPLVQSTAGSWTTSANVACSADASRRVQRQLLSLLPSQNFVIGCCHLASRILTCKASEL